MNDEATKRCLECGTLIPAAAVVCSVCKAPQDWTRYPRRWAAFGVVIAGLIPLWAGAWSLVQLAIRSNAADLGVVARACIRKNANVVVTNRGDGPAMLIGAGLSVFRNGVKEPHEIEMRFDGAQSVIAPKQSVDVALWRYSGDTKIDLPHRLQPGEKCEIKFSISWRDLRSVPGPRSAECDCPD